MDITLGVEEECFLVDPESLDLLADPDPAIFKALEEHPGPHDFVHELLRTQVETNTRVCESVAEVREAVIECRQTVSEVAAEYGAVVMAASTHPFAKWQSQMITPKERYQKFSVVYQETLRRFLIGGMHIHAGFGDLDTRVRVMTALRRFIPVFNALSASSPFDSNRQTGFKSWRLNIVGSLPRTGVPEAYHSASEFQELLSEYQRWNFIKDGTELWWDIRPSHRYPTVELRVCDVCTLVEDTVCLVALYASLISWLERKDRKGQLPYDLRSEIIRENRWQAARYGMFAFLADPVSGERVDIYEQVAELVDTLSEDARHLGCESELNHALEILRLGTGADRQLDHYRSCRLDGATHDEALRSVVKLILSETTKGFHSASTD